MRPVAALARLNEVDLAVDALQSRLTQIASELREPQALRDARTALRDCAAELATWQARQMACEEARARAGDRLASTEQRLYGGSVRSPKELEDLQRDREQLRRQQSQCEDELLEALLAVETATDKQTLCRAELDRLVKEWETTQATLRAEQARLTARLLAEQGRQATARKAAPAELLPIYDSLRSRRGGRAVAELDGDICLACKVAVSPTKREAAREGTELVYCENCGRLLWSE